MKILDIVSTLSTIARTNYDGSDNEALKKIDLKRNKGNPILDSRFMDNFSVFFQGPFFIVRYHSQIALEELHDPKFEEKIEEVYSDIIKFFKDEFKRYKGNSISFKDMGEVVIDVRYLNRQSCWIQSKKIYKINNIDKEQSLNENIKKILNGELKFD